MIILAVIPLLDAVPFYSMYTLYGSGVISQEGWGDLTAAVQKAQDAMRRTRGTGPDWEARHNGDRAGDHDNVSSAG